VSMFQLKHPKENNKTFKSVTKKEENNMNCDRSKCY